MRKSKSSVSPSFIILTIGLCLLTISSYAQNFDPFDGNADGFHAKLTRYFKSEESEKASRLMLADSLNSFKLDTNWDISNLKLHLDRYESLLVSAERHYQYFRLRRYMDKKDSLSKKAYNQVDSLVSLLQNCVSRALLKPAFISINPAELVKYDLLKYRYLLAQAKQEAAYDLSSHDEDLISKLTDHALAKLIDRYDDLMDHITTDSLQYGNKKYHSVNDQSVILKSKDSLLRKAGMSAYYKAYSDHAELLAATLIDITTQKTTLAKIRGFKSAPDRTYQRRLQLSESSVKQILTEITRHADVLKDYQRIQAGQVRKMTGINQIHSWDTYLPVGFTVQQLPFANAKKLILTALAPLGETYRQYFARLLDPANGALDITGGPNRATEFTSIGFPGVPESLYMKSYNGSLREISKLVHEGGHAVHGQLMSDNIAVPSYKNGPSFLYEAYAMFNELMLMDELEKQEKTNEGKAYYTKLFLDKLSLEVFTSAEEGAFEQGIYDGVTNGSINTRKDVDELYSKIMDQYDTYFAGEPQRRSEWINKRLLFDDPLYNVTYLYAMLVSCKLYEMVHDNPKQFALKYTRLLKNGFDAPAEDLLKQFMGFKLDNEALLNSTLQLMRSKTLKLSKLYGQVTGNVSK